MSRIGNAYPCPYCGYVMDAADEYVAGPDYPLDLKTRPEPGSVGVCIQCAAPSVFVVGAFGTRLRLPTSAEWQEWQDDHDWRQKMLPVVAAIVMMRAQKASEGSGRWPGGPTPLQEPS